MNRLSGPYVSQGTDICRISYFVTMLQVNIVSNEFVIISFIVTEEIVHGKILPSGPERRGLGINL